MQCFNLLCSKSNYFPLATHCLSPSRIISSQVTSERERKVTLCLDTEIEHSSNITGMELSTMPGNVSLASMWNQGDATHLGAARGWRALNGALIAPPLPIPVLGLPLTNSGILL